MVSILSHHPLEWLKLTGLTILSADEDTKQLKVMEMQSGTATLELSLAIPISIHLLYDSGITLQLPQK